MPDHVTQELALLPRLGVADLRRRYAHLFGETPRTGNKAWVLGGFLFFLLVEAEKLILRMGRRR
jgi:hypothetical protein